MLRAVAGIEKKRSILQGVEKSVVARHEVGGGAWPLGVALHDRDRAAFGRLY